MTTCHSWPQERDGKVTWMSCMPCDSAIWWYCEDGPEGDGCGWEWVQGLNPRNPRAAQNEAKAPPWFDGGSDG